MAYKEIVALVSTCFVSTHVTVPFRLLDKSGSQSLSVIDVFALIRDFTLENE